MTQGMTPHMTLTMTHQKEILYESVEHELTETTQADNDDFRELTHTPEVGCVCLVCDFYHVTQMVGYGTTAFSIFMGGSLCSRALGQISSPRF